MLHTWPGFKVGLARLMYRSHRRGAVCDDTSQIYWYCTHSREALGTFRVKQRNTFGPQHQYKQYLYRKSVIDFAHFVWL